jgi:hypothetical protein
MRRLSIKAHINKCNCKSEIILQFHDHKKDGSLWYCTVKTAADIKRHMYSNRMREMQAVVFRYITWVFWRHSKMINVLCRYDSTTTVVMLRPLLTEIFHTTQSSFWMRVEPKCRERQGFLSVIHIERISFTVNRLHTNH